MRKLKTIRIRRFVGLAVLTVFLCLSWQWITVPARSFAQQTLDVSLDGSSDFSSDISPDISSYSSSTEQQVQQGVLAY
ncbi:MAG: hypothetical protein AAFY72_06030, partial [Cyanobacteria bacterium J06649_4]